MRISIVFGVLVILGMFMFAGCSDKYGHAVQIYCNSYNESRKTIVTDSTPVQLSVEHNGALAFAQWKSCNTNIAYISATGQVTPVSNGTVKIIAEVNGQRNYIYIKVAMP